MLTPSYFSGRLLRGHTLFAREHPFCSGHPLPKVSKGVRVLYVENFDGSESAQTIVCTANIVAVGYFESIPSSLAPVIPTWSGHIKQ